MTLEELEAIEARANAATPSPWRTGVQNNATLEQTVANAAKHLMLGIGPEVHMVWAPEHPLTVLGPDPEAPLHAVTTAMAGNGPTSPQNAEFIAHARADVPALVAEVRRLRETLRVLIRAARDGYGHVPEAKPRGKCGGCDAIVAAEELLR